MSYYVTNFNKIRQEKSIAIILEALERGFEKFGIDYYLVGALARDVWMRGLNDITPRRATSDIDFGIMIKDSNHFDDLKNYLIKEEKFTPSKENAFVLIAPDKRQVDILPFGAIEQEGKVSVKGTGMTTLYVDGMKEVFEEGVPDVTFEESITFKVCTLPGIVLLKLVAWDDRPEVRTDDIHDIADIMNNFFNIYDEFIWAEHNDLFVDNVEIPVVSARVLGREIGKILKRNEKLKERINAILQKNIDKSDVKMATLIASFLNQTLDEVLILIGEISKGINE
jgi:predicted nucleotidyltransferase